MEHLTHYSWSYNKPCGQQAFKIAAFLAPSNLYSEMIVPAKSQQKLHYGFDLLAICNLHII